MVTMPAWAGVVIQSETSREGTVEDVATIFIEGDALKMQMGGADRETVIYKADKDELWRIDHTRKEYMVLNKALIGKYSSAVNSAMSQLEESLAQMDPAQRAMMEKMFKSQMPGMQAGSKKEIKDTGEKADVNGYATRKYVSLVDGEPVREFWVADWNEVGVDKSTFDVFMKMSGFFEGMMEGIKDSPFAKGFAKNPYADFQKLNGLPVRVRHLTGIMADHESSMKSIEKKTIAGTEFEVPEGYTQTEMPEPAMMR